MRFEEWALVWHAVVPHKGGGGCNRSRALRQAFLWSVPGTWWLKQIERSREIARWKNRDTRVDRDWKTQAKIENLTKRKPTFNKQLWTYKEYAICSKIWPAGGHFTSSSGGFEKVGKINKNQWKSKKDVILLKIDQLCSASIYPFEGFRCQNYE